MSLATIGLVRVSLTRPLPQLVLTTSDSMQVLSTRRAARTLVGPVSPSAVWYTTCNKK